MVYPLGRVTPEEMTRRHARARRAAAKQAISPDTMLEAIVVLLKQLRTIEHLQDHEAVAAIRKRYDQEDF